MIDIHFSIHVIEALGIAYLGISLHQTKSMLIHLADTVLSVNKHLDTLINLSTQEIEHLTKSTKEDFKQGKDEEDVNNS